MSDVTNLRRFRKRKARAEADARAAQNRARFGRTPEQKRRDEHEAEASRRKLDQLRRDPADEPAADGAPPRRPGD